MRDILSKALEAHPDLDVDLKKWTFARPFEPIVHRWNRLIALQAVTTESPDKVDFDDLMAFLTPTVSPYIKSLSEIKDTGKVSFNSVWQIFPPDELVVTSDSGEQAIGRVGEHKEGYKGLTLSIETVHWNGLRCGFQMTDVAIEFHGLSRVTALLVYPLISPSPRRNSRKR